MSEKTIELYPLPENWTWTTIGEITEQIEKINPRETPEQEFSYLDISGIDNKRNVVKEVKAYLGKNAPSRARQVVRANDILFSTVRTYLRNVALVPKQYDGQVASTGFSILRAKENIEYKYLFYFVLSRGFLEKLNTFQRGTSYPAVRDQDVRVQPIPLPPLNEQRRIVARIEELFSQLDAGVTALEQARAQLKRYRQALLKAAFEGRLTADWRRAHAGELEPADALLARIRAAREARWRAQLAAWEEAVRAWEAAGKPGRKPRKPRKPKELPPLTEEERAVLPELPEGWAWVRVGDITINHDGKRIPLSREYRKNFQGNYPYYGAVEIIDYVADYIFDGKFILIGEDGANLFSRSKPLAFVVEGKFWVNNHAHVLEAVEVDEDFFAYQFSSLNLHKYITGTAQPKLTQANLQKIPIAVCSKQEQLEISSILARNLSTIDHLDQTIEQALARAAALRQAILKRAFAGRLAPQDPNDEPAGELLARLRAGYTT